MRLQGAAPRTKSGHQPGQKHWGQVTMVIVRSQECRLQRMQSGRGAWRLLPALSSSLPSPHPHCPPLCSCLSPSLLSPPSGLHPCFPIVCLSSLFPFHSPTEPCPQPPASALRRQGHAVSKLSEMVQHLWTLREDGGGGVLQVCWPGPPSRGRLGVYQ